jgi:rhodanese-related sulfurtransferase
MHHVNQIDFSGIHMLEGLVQTYRDRGGDVFLVRVGHAGAAADGDRPAAWNYMGENGTFWTKIALSTFSFHHVLDPAMCIYECPVRVFRECQNLPKRFDLLAPSQLDRPVLADCPTVASRDLWQQLRSGPPEQRPIILDVREPREFRRSHIPEAQSLPLSTLLTHGVILAAGSADRSRLSVSGRRSRRAAAVLRDLGFTRRHLWWRVECKPGKRRRIVDGRGVRAAGQRCRFRNERIMESSLTSRNIGLDLTRVTEAAALAAGSLDWIRQFRRRPCRGHRAPCSTRWPRSSIDGCDRHR